MITIQSQRVFHVDSVEMLDSVIPKTFIFDSGLLFSSSNSQASKSGSFPGNGTIFFESVFKVKERASEKVGMNFFFAPDVSLLRLTLVVLMSLLIPWFCFGSCCTNESSRSVKGLPKERARERGRTVRFFRANVPCSQYLSAPRDLGTRR